MITIQEQITQLTVFYNFLPLMANDGRQKGSVSAPRSEPHGDSQEVHTMNIAHWNGRSSLLLKIDPNAF